MAEPSLIVMAQPSPGTLALLQQVIRSHGFDKLLGATMSAPGNWHQTLSVRYRNEQEYVEKLLRACGKIVAEQASVTFNRIAGPSGLAGERMHWEFRGSHSKSLTTLLAAIQSSLETEGIADHKGDRPHITISYFAPTPLESISFAPITWVIDEIFLVRSGGRPFHYEILGRWPLLPPKTPVIQQLRLFS